MQVDLDSRLIAYGVIRRITHWPRLGSQGVIADFYRDKEHTDLIAAHVQCRTYSHLQLAGFDRQIRWQ
jgi:hypothetical protein